MGVPTRINSGMKRVQTPDAALGAFFAHLKSVSRKADTIDTTFRQRDSKMISLGRLRAHD